MNCKGKCSYFGVSDSRALICLCSFRQSKQPGHEFNISPPPRAEVNNEWSYTSTPPYAFMLWREKPLILFTSKLQNSGSHFAFYEDSGILECDAVYIGY